MGQGEIHQRSLVHPRTVGCGLAAFGGAGQQLRPIGERAALQRLDGVHRTSAGQQERTLLVALLAEAQQRRDPAQVAALELGARDVQVLGQPRNVVAGEIDEALLIAAGDASRLALEAHTRV